MYPSKGSGAYGQQQYSGQQAYGQIPGAADMGAQHAMASHQSMMGTTQEADLSGYRAHSAQGAQYGGPYAAVYGSAALSSAHQAGGVGGKGAASSGIQSRYPSALPESSKLPSTALGSNLGMNNDDYVSASSRGYAQKGDPFSAVKSSDYSSMDRRHYGDQAAYLGRDLQNDPARRYADSVSIGQQQLTDVHGHMDQASLLRQQQILKAQSLSGSDMRQAEYLAARAAPIHHGSQEYSSYGGRMDIDPRSLPILGNPPYSSQHAASILGGAPRRNVDDMYTQASSSVYGVSLPPGRDYVSGKGLHGQSLESDYQTLLRGHPSSITDERKDDRSAYRRELERDEERRRELIREKEKEREREERERQRERERERERLLERRERERERDRKRASDARRERTPPRSRDHRGSSLLKDERTPRRASPRRVSPRRASPRRVSPRRVSPRREALHRHRSPVKEKKREYICKVFPFCLVDVERDYLSLNRRYPRLFISPECSKVVLHWPKQSLHLSVHTPVSFEHEYVEVDNKGDEKALVSSDELSRMKHKNTIWNAKVILMSGMSSGALNEMCSYRSSDEKIIHFNNILRFAILKKDHSFMAIGGPWNEALDGGDPSVEDSPLIQTARRYLKDITQLDLQNCQHWNRFLEIHYNRIGEDGLFSHKEITVIFVPDLSECLPSLDTWRSLWLAHKKIVAGRERQLAAKDKKSAGKKESRQEKVTAEGSAGKGTRVAKTGSNGPIPEKETDKVKADDTQDSSKESNKKDAVDHKGKGHLPDEKSTEENAEGAGKEDKSDGKKITDGANADLAADKQKPVKRKIVKKVVKGKVAGKKATEATVEDAPAKLDDKVDVKDDGDQQSKQEAVVKEEDKAEPANVKTFTRKKVVKKVPARKSAQKVENTDSSANQTEKKPEIETENRDEKMIKKEPVEAATPQETGVKTTGKKKIIRRVIKRKVSGTVGKNVAAIKKEVGDEVDTVVSQKASKEEENADKVGKNDNAAVGTSNSEDRVISDEAKTSTEEKEKTEKESKKENKSNEQNSMLEKSVSKSSTEPEVAKDKDLKKDDHGSKKERTKDEKEHKSRDAKHDPNQKSSKEGMEKGKPEEPPQHPGLFLQTKRNKGSKVRSMSLSLDGLLDYNDKDIEESTFELSVFAESLNELLQYQMGCRLLSFLEKLRKRFVIKNQRKRQRDENSEKQNEDNLLKRPKVTDESAGQNESPKSGKKDTPDKSRDEIMVEAGPAAEQESKMEAKSDDDIDDVEDPEENESDDDNENDNGDEEEEDPEEIIEDDQEMNDVAPSSDGVQEDKNSAKTDELKAETERVVAEEDYVKNTTSNNNTEPLDEKSEKEKKEDDKRSGTANSDSAKDDVVDKEVLQAFRYFDHNRVGYIKVEDLRCLLHNLGKFISHRDVKELVQSALFESNTPRDNRIFYKKLVKLTDL